MITEGNFAGQYQFRDRVFENLERDLLGFSTPDEVIQDPPITRYLTGVLYPQSPGSIDASKDVDIADDYDESSAPDPAVSLANVRYPSSMGITFAVDAAAASSIRVEISCGVYEELEGTADETDAGQKHQGSRSRGWQRRQISLWQDVAIDDVRQFRKSISPGLDLFARVRRPAEDGQAVVTLALINGNKASSGSTMKDADSFFQPQIVVTAPKATRTAFIERPAPGPKADDADLRSYQLLYRHTKTFAIGHGCAADWAIGEEPTADCVRSTFVPTYDLRLAISNPDIQLPCLSLHFLARGPRDAVISELRRLPELYMEWVAQQRTVPLPTIYTATATENLDACDAAAVRMKAGIELLVHDETAWAAFSMASEAMLTVRSRSDWLRAGRPEGALPEDGRPTWYPFQLGFLLLCLAGIADPSRPDRELVDLLWFPTGGGKTEAYLGLIAFTVFLRRLRLGPSGAGVTALMRYTLRLLTIQQFERAAALICACEAIRRSHPQLGTEPISLGLWVGSDGTPNKRKDAELNLKRIRAGAQVDKGNPVQLKSCPWCWRRLDGYNYYLNASGTQLVVACRGDGCTFRDGLPVYVVDDDVYDWHPSLIIATADKFAGIAWRDRACAIFNLDRPSVPAPELIIQDELHLISGPLGTLAGLYEAAVDAVCASGATRPKVVASTATIRRAKSQTAALFDRPVRQFPPPAIDARSSFFSIEAEPAVKGTRRYVGLMAPGTSQATLLVRAYASLLQSAKNVPGSDENRDPYWTLVGYFNSLRVLGGARMQVQDDVEDRLKQISAESGVAPRNVDQVIELTSRESSADIPAHLRQMSVCFPGKDALDVVLATNMISVGVDVDRIGLMVVMGQPQGTSEYIQATSRVGRQHPGLVVVLFNAARSRDRSHYEAFLGYHGALYRQVEATSVTPFSPRARDRALHAVLIAIARMRIPALRSNDGARAAVDYEAELRAIRDELLTRVGHVSPDQSESSRLHLDAVIDRWLDRARSIPQLCYWDDKKPDRALLVGAGGDDDDGESFPTLWSLRDVDQASNLYLVR
jgi:hypothetical protein